MGIRIEIRIHWDAFIRSISVSHVRTCTFTHPHTYLGNSDFLKLRKLHSLNMQHLMIEPDVKKHVELEKDI